MIQGEAGFVKLVTRTVTGVAEFRGRSRRTEAVYYLIASGVVTAALGKILMEILPVPHSLTLLDLVRLLIFIPWFALFARRLHDQDKSGWLALSLPAVFICVGIAGYLSASRDPLMDGEGAADPFYWLTLVWGLMVLVLFFWPGTKGPNRYGTDPRFAAGSGRSDESASGVDNG